MACYDGGEPKENSVGEPKTHMIRKGGYFYRPGFSGYTEAIEQAGLFTQAEAEAHAAGAREVTAPSAVEAMRLYQVTDEKLAETINRLMALHNLLQEAQNDA